MAADLDGARLPAFAGLPFAGILLSIALLPLLAPSFWHHHYGKVAALWSVLALVAMQQRAGCHHLRIEARATAQQAMEDAAVAIRPIHHRSDGQPPGLRCFSHGILIGGNHHL